MSVRSIQRIENGNIMPRQYAIKVLAEFLGFSLEDLEKTPEVPMSRSFNLTQRVILSLGSVLSILAVTLTYTSQSATFPETIFDAQVGTPGCESFTSPTF